MLCEVGRRTDKHRGAEVGKPRLQLCIGEARIDLLVEPVDDLDGRFPGRADAEPAACLVARYEFYSIDEDSGLNIICTCPASRSVSAGGEPR